MLERYFGLRALGTNPRRELTAGLVTFLTMAYIIVVQPAILSGAMFGMETGMDLRAVMFATCVAAAAATAMMGLLARYPIALAPGMGQNFFFVFTAIPAAAAIGYEEDPWRVGLGAVFLSGVAFLVLSFLGVRKKLVDAVSPSMKAAIAVGIGFFIAFIGLQNSTLVTADPGTMVALNVSFLSPDLIIFFIGFATSAVLMARGVRGAILVGIVAACGAALLLRFILPMTAWGSAELVTESLLMTQFRPAEGVVAMPPSPEPVMFKLDVVAALSLHFIPIVLIFFFMDFFDTMGTLIGVSGRAGLLVNNKLPRATQAFASDATGTVFGSLMGTSTVTSYIESTAGIAEGGRSGLTAVTVAVLFLLALFFTPLVEMIATHPSITAPALVLVGAMMAQQAVRIEWEDLTETIPCFVIILTIPLTFSIGDGIALGFIVYPLVKLLAGRGRELNIPLIVLAVILAFYFIAVRGAVPG